MGKAERGWVVDAERLRVAQQYAKRPEFGLIVEVRQRTTGAGRGILLPPAFVEELRDWLTGWLDTNYPGAVPPVRKGAL